MSGSLLLVNRKFVAITLIVSALLFIFLVGVAFNLVQQPGTFEKVGSAGEPKAVELSDLSEIYVDNSAVVASDDSLGSSSAPLRTIEAAVRRTDRRNEAGLETRIVIRPGTYRERVDLPINEKGTDAPITLQGLGEGVIVSGSDVWAGWEREEDSIYSHGWPYKWGAVMPPGWEDKMAGEHLARNPVILRREMIFVEGSPLTQVLSISELRKTRESFYVSESKERVYIRPAESTKIDEATVEVAVRSALVHVAGRSNVTIDNLTVMHAASSVQAKAVAISDSSGIQVSNTKILWNSAIGLHFRDSKGIVVRDTSANFNGISGFSAFHVEDVLFEDTETSHNNWRGSVGAEKNDRGRAIDPNFVDFAAGQKFFGLHRATFRRHKSEENSSGGLWFDSNNSEVTLDSVALMRNMTHGVFFEASPGPLLVRHSLICGNETGVLIGNSSKGLIEGNVIAGNHLSQIFVAGSDERVVEDARSGTAMRLTSEDWSVLSNRVESTDEQPAVATYLLDAPWGHFISTLRSDQNTWFFSGSGRIFEIAGGKRLSLEQWKSHTAQDAQSASVAGGVPCTPL